MSKSKGDRYFAYLAIAFGIFCLGWAFYTFSVSSAFPIILGGVCIFIGGWQLLRRKL